MRKIFGLLCLLAMVMLLAGCKGDEQKLNKLQLTGIPFLSEGDSVWSMISPDGKVIFSKKIINRPCIAFDNRFFVREDNELYSLYTCEETPVKVASGFVDVNGFVDGKALVSKPGGYIQMIDVNGTVLLTLDKISDKNVEKAFMADDGYISFMTTDHCWGLLDPDGNVVFKPEYGRLEYKDGIVITSPESEKMFAQYSFYEKMTFHIHNLKGEETGIIKGSRYVVIDMYEGKYLKVYKADENKYDRRYGLFNLKGEPVVRPSKLIHGIINFQNEDFIFYDGDKYGLMNTEGKIILEPEYDHLEFFDDKLLQSDERDADYNRIYTLIDKQGEQVGNEQFHGKYMDFSELDGKHALMESIDGKNVLVNKDGTVVEGMPEISNFSLWRSSDYVGNQHVNVDSVVNHLNISLQGFDGLTVNMTPKECVNKKKDEFTKWVYDYVKEKKSYSFDAKEVYEDLERTPITSPYYYGKNFKDEKDDLSSLDYVAEYNGVKYRVLCYYPENIVKGKDNESFVNKPMSDLLLSIGNGGKKNGYLRQFFKAFASKIRPLAKVIVENDNYLCVASETDMVLIKFDKDGTNIYIHFTSLSDDYVPNVEWLTEQAKKVADVKEKCRVEISE